MRRGKKSRLGAWTAIVVAVGAAATASTMAQPGARVDQVQLVIGADTLYGTLQMPPANKPVPLVIILAGSGPTDRDGNTPLFKGKNDSLRMLADSLLDHGIASLRYDKRGVAASARAAKAESLLRVTTYADDATEWAKRYRDDARFSTLIFLGHSEGALMGTMAAKKTKVDGLVLVAGAGRPAREIIHEQLKRSLSADLVKKSDAIMDTLLMGKPVTDVPLMLMSLYRPSVQPYMQSWLPVDPAAELKDVKLPTMVIWGTSDIQISKADFNRLASARGGIRKLEVPHMNHVLKPTLDDPMAQMMAYADSTIVLAPGLVDPLVRFVRGVKRAG